MANTASEDASMPTVQRLVLCPYCAKPMAPRGTAAIYLCPLGHQATVKTLMEKGQLS